MVMLANLGRWLASWAVKTLSYQIIKRPNPTQLELSFSSKKVSSSSSSGIMGV
jgi:hypothetical protein